MIKNDKIIFISAVVVCIIILLGIYFYTDPPGAEELTDVTYFSEMTGSFTQRLEGYSITVPDDDPFFALVSTSLAVHYTIDAEQKIIPMYIKNFDNPSNTITKLQHSQLNTYRDLDLHKLGYTNSKDFSLKLAQKYWEKSDAAVIIKHDFDGYTLGVNAAPLASYLSAPVIVCDEITDEVLRVLTHLDVHTLIICGDFEAYHGTFDYLKFDNVEQIVENTSLFVTEKFGQVDYITLTNPIDAFRPEILDSITFSFGPNKVKSASMNRQNLLGFMRSFTNEYVTWKFTIPDDYKYALIELEGFNHDLAGVDEFGDHAEFSIAPAKEGQLTLGGAKTTNGVAQRDRAGNVIEDKLYKTIVLYDCGGNTYTITASGSWTLLAEGQVSAKVTVKKLAHPVYEMMGGLSSLAPYLTAYHRGIVFGKSEFAFTADDDIITDKGRTSPGYYTAGRNIDLVPLSNKHIIKNIHEPLNALLAQLAGLPYGRDVDLKDLTDYYRATPVHIALLGGTTVLPRYIYENEVIPIDDVSALRYLGGGGTPSDNIYGNIDPVKYKWDNIVSDVYGDSDHPFLENIVGRITGWDVQDANALILRSLFYHEIISDLGGWKNNYGNLYGGGVDFRAPLWVQTLNKIPGIRLLLNLVTVASGGMINYAVPPWKIDTGFSRIASKNIADNIGEKLGFTVTTALHEEAMIEGYSTESLNKIKTASLWNRLTFSKSQVAELAGQGNVKGREILENSNFIWLCGHGSPYNLGLEGGDLVSSGFGVTRLYQKIYKNLISPYVMVGFWGPGGGLARVGEYYPRRMSTVNMEPSFIWLESCFVGKLTGVTPQANVGQGVLHAGVAAMVSSTSGSNIPGGYLPGKNFMFDTWLGTRIRYNQWEKNTEQGLYPDFHFGSKIYADMCDHLGYGTTIGEAFRNAKNQYLIEDEDWELWWSPPLSDSAAVGLGTHMAPKYTSFHQYVLYGDPGFKPYVPINN